MTTIEACPICSGVTFKPFLSCKDYTVSQETFQLVECETCQFKITTPRPDNVGPYYVSDAYISHAKKAHSLLDNIYVLARRFTLQWKVALVRQHNPITSPISILDYGCGTGQFLQQCKHQGWNVFGIEPSAIARESATLLTGSDITESIEQTKTRQYTAITLWHVLEHVEDINATLQKLTSQLTDSGTMFIAVPNHRSEDATHYNSAWAAFDVPRHLWHFSQQNMQKLARKHNLTLKGIVPMKLDSYYVSLLSETYLGKKSIHRILSALVNGYRSNQRARRTTEYSSLLYILRK